MKKNLVLLGMMAVGKTTVGKIIAKNQRLKFVDIDSSIEKNNSMTIKEILTDIFILLLLCILTFLGLCL